MISSNVLEMLDRLSLEHPSAAPQISEIKNNFRDSMWYIITDQIFDLTLHPEFDQGKDLISFFNDFVKNLDRKINHLKYIRIAVNCSKQFGSKFDMLYL